MKTLFDRAVSAVLAHEGGYVNDPKDPGGETKFGISKRAYPNVDIAGLTLPAALAIYRRDYWDRIRADELPPDVAWVAFDTAVNMGVSQAVRLLQRAAGVTTDGVIGPKTVLAAKAPGVAEKMARLRADIYRSLPTFSRFGRGWIRRVEENLAEARGLGNEEVSA